MIMRVALVAMVLALGGVPLHGQVKPLQPGGRGATGVEPLPRRPSTGDVIPLSSELGDSRAVKVLAEGTARIYAGNAEKAREAALRQAYAEAVGHTIASARTGRVVRQLGTPGEALYLFLVFGVALIGSRLNGGTGVISVAAIPLVTTLFAVVVGLLAVL